MLKLLTYHKRSVGIASLVIVLGVVVFVLETMNVTHFFHSSTASFEDPKNKTSTYGAASSTSTKGEAYSPSPQSPNITPSNTTQPSHTKTDGNSGATSSLLPPTGSFVSAHKGIGMDNVLTSVCNTSPGAQCEIIFTSSSSKRSLYAQTADVNGAVFWDRWTPRSIGITPGVWTIEAKASLDGQTKTTRDVLTLEVNS